VSEPSPPVEPYPSVEQPSSSVEQRAPASASRPDPQDDGELRRLSPLTPLARSGIFLVVAGYAGGREVLQEGKLAGIAIAFAAVVVAGLLFGLASWYRTFFRITPTELRIDTGVISRRSRRVRLDRVLEVGINQPVIARLLGLAELKIETATAESEVSLAYLPLKEAHSVRQVLLDHRTAAKVAEAGPGGVPVALAEPVLLVDVPVRWQLIGLVASGEALGLVLVGIVMVVLVLSGVPLGAFGVGVATFIGAAFSLARKVIGWWDWKVSAVPTGIQVKHGMFSLSTRTFNVERLQGVRVTEPLLQRPFGLARLDLSVAGGGLKDSGEDHSNGVALPVAPREIVWRMAADLIGADPSAVLTTPPPARARWLRPVGRTWLRFGMDDRLVVSRKGWISRRTDLVPLARVQSFRVTRGPLQRLLGLASVHADSPVGLVDVSGPHRDPAEARELMTVGVERARRARLPQAVAITPEDLGADEVARSPL
jgi:putative membrane protein